MNLPKVTRVFIQTPGTLTFDLAGDQGLSLSLENKVRNKLKANYFLKTLEFGDASNAFDLPISHTSPVLQSYIEGLQGNIKTREFIQDFRDADRNVNYYNHLKIIPLYIDDGTVSSEV